MLPRLFFVKLRMRKDPKPWSFELWLSQITVQTTHKDTAIKEGILPFRITVKGDPLCPAEFKAE